MRRGSGRSTTTLWVVLAVMLPALQPCAFALDPSLDANQYSHTAWKVREGFAKGTITPIVQTPDGYIWLGTDFGLLRFDGVKTVPLELAQGQHLPSNRIFSLLAARDGTLWIGTTKGLASWKSGKLTQYAELAGQAIFALLEDHEGTIWVGGVGFPPPGRLCSIQKGRVHCIGADGTLDAGVIALYEDRKGNLWAATNTRLWRWKPGSPQCYMLPADHSSWAGLAENSDGTILISLGHGIGQPIGGKIEPYLLPGLVHFAPRRLIYDRDGGLWIGTSGEGLLHVHQGRTDVFTSADGLSGDKVNYLFEDRESNIWVATDNGLDRFHAFPVVTFTAKQGLSSNVVVSVLADKDENIWLSTFGGLDRLSRGKITPYSRDGRLNGLGLRYLFQDHNGRLWVSPHRDFGYLEGDRFVPVNAFPRGVVVCAVEDSSGNLWIANQDFGLVCLRERSMVQRIPRAGLGSSDPVKALAGDPVRGGLWLGFLNGGISYFVDGQIRASYTGGDGLGEGRVSSFLFDHDSALWISTAGGLSRLKNGRIATLTSKNGLPCDAVHWAIEDDDHSFWLYMPCGLVRIARSEMDGWAAAVDQDKNTNHRVQVTIFDSSDGVRTVPDVTLGSQVAKSPDGRLWFLPWDGVSVVDPHHLPFNKLPPPVHIEQITADRKTYDASSQMRLPPLVRDLEIDYTALSLVAPEKVRFRYKLENWDRDWQDAGNRREAVYGNLSPGNYRFRVMACNNSGVWNEAGTFLDFSVAPAYYQTLWFRLSCVFVFLALLAGLYRLRVRQLAGQFNLRLEERVNERTRIARDLHDTLLQSFQGLMLKFRVLAFLLPDRPAEARKMLDEVMEQARTAITEGRDAVHGLRSSLVTANDLAHAISTLGEQLNADQTGQQSPDFRVRIEGATREIVPLLRDDVYRIAGEALRNAFRHAHPRHVEVEIRYDQRQFRLRVRDDGKGIDARALAGDCQPGHYGLPGMHERAKLIGGKLEVWSELDSGTEVELTIPGSLAYVGSPVKRRFRFWRNGA